METVKTMDDTILELMEKLRKRKQNFKKFSRMQPNHG